MSKKKKDTFDKLADVANADYEAKVDMGVSAIEAQMNEVETRKQDLLKQVGSQEVVCLKDQAYIDHELKTLIEMSMNVLQTLHEDIRVGSHSRQFEVFATLSNSVREHLRELRDLNMKLLELQMFNQDTEESQKDESGDVRMSGGEMMEFFKQLKNDSQINAVDADFTIEDDKDENK